MLILKLLVIFSFGETAYIYVLAAISDNGIIAITKYIDMKLAITTISLIILTSSQIRGQSSKEITTKSGLRYTILKVGSGEAATGPGCLHRQLYPVCPIPRQPRLNPPTSVP